MASKPDPGKPIRPGDSVFQLRDWLNWILRMTLRNQIHFDQGCGIDAVVGPDGVHPRLADQAPTKLPAFVTVEVSARSGTTPGDGTVALAEWDGTDFTQGDEELDVLNLYEHAGPIPVGTFVWIILWQNEWFIDNGDCDPP